MEFTVEKWLKSPFATKPNFQDQVENGKINGKVGKIEK